MRRKPYAVASLLQSHHEMERVSIPRVPILEGESIAAYVILEERVVVKAALVDKSSRPVETMNPYNIPRIDRT